LCTLKDYDRWSEHNEHKKKIHNSSERPFYHAGEICWCSVGINIGNELDGTGNEHDRPVLVAQQQHTVCGRAVYEAIRLGRVLTGGANLAAVNDFEGHAAVLALLDKALAE